MYLASIAYSLWAPVHPRRNVGSGRLGHRWAGGGSGPG
jgi:hypothetical protein